MVTDSTKKIISLAEKPSTFGITFHNKGYRLLGLDYLYLPLNVEKDELSAIISLIKKNFYGSSVSMPHKEAVIPYLDLLDPIARKIGAVNTITNTQGKLKGYNTDYYGAQKAITSTLSSIKGKEVLMFGAGGVAKAIGLAVTHLGGRLTITNRNQEKGKKLAQQLKVRYLDWEKRHEQKAYLFINATSIGFLSPEESPLSDNQLNYFESVMDVVIGETKLIHQATQQQKKVIPGLLMTVHQATKQFHIYTGKELPLPFIQSYIIKPTKKLHLVLDIDGVMTTGQFLYDKEGKSHKLFGPHDSDGLKLLREKVHIHFITADKRGLPISKKRIEDMGYDINLVSEGDRYAYVRDTYGLKHTIYVGDGIFDAPIIRDCLFGIAPSNARIEAKRWAKFVTPSKSAEGAVCDACIKIDKTFFRKKK